MRIQKVLACIGDERSELVEDKTLYHCCSSSMYVCMFISVHEDRNTIFCQHESNDT